MSDVDIVCGLVNDLTEPRAHREQLDEFAFQVRRHTGHPSPGWHVTAVMPSLIDQLRAALTWERQSEEASFGRGPVESRPPGNLDALDALMRIEAGVGRWNGGEGRLLLEERLRGLVGLATVLGHADLSSLRRDLFCWRAWARVESGWDRRTFTADVACPCCEHRTLRIRGDGTAARCSNCGAAWSEDADDLPSVFDLGAAIEDRRDRATSGCLTPYGQVPPCGREDVCGRLSGPRELGSRRRPAVEERQAGAA